MSAVPEEPGTVSRELLKLVFQVAARLRDGLQEAHLNLDLPPAQAQALSVLEGPVPMRELASRLACDASNVTGIVDGLEGRGLVERRPDPRDRRVKQLVLTPEGKRRRAALDADLDRVAAKVFDLPEEEQRTLRELLGRTLGTQP
jgi:DNA-binding MarR family transcriptional regulator